MSEALLTILAGLGGMALIIGIVVLSFWLLDRADEKKHQRQMDELDERFIAALRKLADDYGDAVGALEVWLEQPTREACELNTDEQDAWQRITGQVWR